jgi:hypothetical protein
VVLVDEPVRCESRGQVCAAAAAQDINTETAGARGRFPHQCPPQFASPPLGAGDEISSIERLALD